MSQNHNKTNTNHKDIAQVQLQYQNLPYPMRDPEDEKKRLLLIIGETLAELNHFLYKGKRDFNKGFRVLVAGGGTGDSSTFFGEQLKDIKNSEIIYLDFSPQSMEIAKKRAEIRGLTNIKFICDSIFNIPKLNLGKFDFINCSGVLHHLHSPNEGLKILADSLAEDGGMHLMVYAQYGRTGLYQIQKLMQMVNDGITDIGTEIKNGNKIMSSLPNTNWFMRGGELLQDHIAFGDIGLYDMFLHKQDRAYSIPELYEFISKADLHFADFAVAESRLILKPESYIKDQELLSAIKSKDQITQQAICEIISGKIIKHDFFVSKIKDSIASFSDLDNIPYFFFGNENMPKQITNHIVENNLQPGNSINAAIDDKGLHVQANINLSISSCTKIIFESLIPNNKTLREIFKIICTELKTDIADDLLINELKITLQPFIDTGRLFLRDKSLPPFKYDYNKQS